MILALSCCPELWIPQPLIRGLRAAGRHTAYTEPKYEQLQIRKNKVMKKLFTVLTVLAICVISFGFYRNWFAVSSPSPAEGSNEVNINLSTDTDKIKEDVETVKVKVEKLTGNDKEDPKEPDIRTKDEDQPKQVPSDDEQL